MSENKIIVSSSGVVGDITSCGIESKQIGVIRDGAFSFTETTQHMTYDVCTKQIVNEYSVEGITGFGGMSLLLGVPIALVIIVSLLIT